MSSTQHRAVDAIMGNAELILQCINNGNLERIKQLIHQRQVDAPLKDGWSALMYACLAGKYDIIKYLLETGSNANQHCYLFTPLMALCSSTLYQQDKLAACAQLLLNHDADVDAMEEHKTTALMIACKNGHKELVSLFINANCDVNKVDNEGMTALHLAVTSNKPEIVGLLLDKGALKDIKDKRSRTPLNFAQTKGLKVIIEMLEDPEEIVKEDLPQFYVRKRTSFEEMLAELPSGMDGFYKEVGVLLSGMGLERFEELFDEKNISLVKFLNITNDQLKSIGLRFSTHRLRIMKDNLKFIQHPWSQASLPSVRDNSVVNLVDVTRSMANTVKHLHILWASSLYCTERLTFEPEDLKVSDSASSDKQSCDLYEVLLHTRKQVECLNRELKKIQQQASTIEKENKVSAVDLILPQKDTKTIAFNFSIITVLMTGVLAWKFNFFGILKKCL